MVYVFLLIIVAIIFVLALDGQSPDTRIQGGNGYYGSSDDYFGHQMSFHDMPGDNIWDHDWNNSSIGIDNGLFDNDSGCADMNETNPATGLPMTDGFCSLDVGGNPYGTDMDDHFGSMSDDSFDSGGSDDW